MITIRSGQTAIHDPQDSRVYELDWDTDNLEAGVLLDDAGVITITCPQEDSPNLEGDELALLAGSRSARIRLTGGTLGRRYRVAHQVTTNESPQQTKEQSFYVLVQHR